ncbi:MAG: hypothetical protein ABI183_24405 [Polyangiaceae bacterium]
MKHKIVVAYLCVAAVLLSCTKASESTDAKRTPKPPPNPTNAETNPALTIAIEIDGAPSAALDSTKLNATEPDFKNEDHRAWKLTSLLPNTNRPGVVFAVTGDQDISVVLRSPRAPSDPIPGVMLNRRGELFANMIDPADPFPAFHGQGGRLARPGDPSTRIANVKKIRAYVESDSGSALK